MLLKCVIKNLLLELCKVNRTNSIQIYTSMPPLEQQSINTRTGPQEGIGGIPSLHGNRETCSLLFTEQMGQDVSAESGSCTHQRDCSLLWPAYLALLGQSRQGDFRRLCFTNLAWGPLPQTARDIFICHCWK